MLRILLLVGSIVVCVVPERYRRSWPVQGNDLLGPALASGALEFLLGAPGTMLYFAGAMSMAKLGLGVAGLILNPFFPFVFLFFEGMVRLLAALSSEQVLPILPLQIVAWIHDARDGKASLEALGPLVPDKVERGDGTQYALRVSSCRAKPHWNTYMTIRFEEEFYQLCGEEMQRGSRKFVYLLRKSPPARLVVVVYAYHPDDVLKPEAPPRRWTPAT